MTNQRLSNLFSGLFLFMTRLYQQNSINFCENHLRALVLRRKIHNDKCIENPERWDLQMEPNSWIVFYFMNQTLNTSLKFVFNCLSSFQTYSITMLLKCIQNFHESLYFVAAHYKNHESVQIMRQFTVNTPPLVYSSFVIAPTFDCKSRCKTVVHLLLIV